MSAAAKPNPVLVTRAQLLEELGITENTEWRYRKEGMPCIPMAGKDIFYNLDKVKTWMLANGKTGKQGRPNLSDDPELAKIKQDLAATKLRKETVLCEKHEHLLDLAKGRVLKRDEVEAGMTARVAAVKAALMALPGKLAQRLAMRNAVDVQVELEAEVRAVLEGFAKASAEALPPVPTASSPGAVAPSSISAALGTTRPATDEQKVEAALKEASQ